MNRQSVRRKERRENEPGYREKMGAQGREYYHRRIKHLPGQKEKKRKYHRVYRARPEAKLKLRENARAYRERKRVWNLALGAIRRCRKSGMACDAEFLKALGRTRPESCRCCGRKLNYAFTGKAKRAPLDSPSLDRIVATLGYVEGNVAIICWRCNALKRDALLCELEAIVAYMKEAAR